MTTDEKLTRTGRGGLRYGLRAPLLLWGGFEFAAFEAEGIRPLVVGAALSTAAEALQAARARAR